MFSFSLLMAGFSCCFCELSANDWKQTEEEWAKSWGLCQWFRFIKGDKEVVSDWKPFIYWHADSETVEFTERSRTRCLPKVFFCANELWSMRQWQGGDDWGSCLLFQVIFRSYVHQYVCNKLYTEWWLSDTLTLLVSLIINLHVCNPGAIFWLRIVIYFRCVFTYPGSN